MTVFTRSLSKIFLYLSYLLSLPLTNAYAQEGTSQKNTLGQDISCIQESQTNLSCAPSTCNCSYGCSNLYLEHIEGNGIGYKQGYSTLAIFLSPGSVNQTTRFFFDARAHVFNRGQLAGNVGGGVRFWNSCIQRVFGLNAYYDCREACRTYQQVGLGVEMLGCDFDFRVNGYIPVGKRDRFSLEDEAFYSGGKVARLYHRQYCLGGFDAEVETSLCRWFCNCCYDPYIAAGGYYFQGTHKHIRGKGNFSYIDEIKKNTYVRGGKIRAGIRYLDFLTFEVRATFDNVYHNNVQGVIALNWPFGGKSCDSCRSSCPPCIPSCDYACRPVIRNEIIVLNKECFWGIIDPCNPCCELCEPKRQKLCNHKNKPKYKLPRRPTCDKPQKPKCAHPQKPKQNQIAPLNREAI